MSTSVLRISTLLLAGVGIGVTLGAMFCSNLPVWLGLMVIAGCSFVAYEGCTLAH